MKRFGVAIIGLVLVAGAWRVCAEAAGAANRRAQPTKPTEGKTMREKATFAAGCFWGVEDAFRHVKGVTNATVGYTGGHTANPTYEQVCSHMTGHAEAVEVEYDPTQLSYEQLLDAFWSIHDPTTLNRQGPDVGDQYRSAIFYDSPQQHAAAEASKERLQRSGAYKRPVVTEIAAATSFYRAEEYHQRYFEKNGGGQCHINFHHKT